MKTAQRNMKSNVIHLSPEQDEFKKRRSIYLELMSKGSKATECRGRQVFFAPIDPILAAQIINACVNPARQRKLSKKDVKFLASQMLLGEFEEQGDPIRFNEEFELIDGQHRVNAVVDSGTSQTFLIYGNLPQERIMYVDQNAKRRNITDRLKIATGHEINVSEQGVFNMLAYGGQRTESVRIVSDNLEKWQKFEEAIRFAARPRSEKRSQALMKAPIRAVVARAYAAGEDIERLEQFLTVIDTQLATSEADFAGLILSREFRREEWKSIGSRNNRSYAMYWHTETLLKDFLDRKPIKKFPRIARHYKEFWEVEGCYSIPHPSSDEKGDEA